MDSAEAEEVEGWVEGLLLLVEEGVEGFEEDRFEEGLLEERSSSWKSDIWGWWIW